MSDDLDTTLRVCSQCRRSLPVDSFGFKVKAKGLRSTKCRECVKAYSAEHYQANRKAYLARAKASNVRIRRRIRARVAELRNGPCADCGRVFPPCCMQFDHRMGRTVTGKNSPEAIANISRSASPGKLDAELPKCDLVCANCHAIRTHNRRLEGWSAKVEGEGIEPSAPAFSVPCSTS